MAPPTYQALAKQSCLPEECLIMVFQHLSHDRSALHALLQVNRQFFRLAVPILYRSPFRLLESKAQSWSWSERTQRQVLLLQLFMCCVQIKQLDRAESQQLQRQQEQQKSEDCHYTNTPTTYKPEESEVDRPASDTATSTIHTNQGHKKSLDLITSTKSKRRQRWWTKKRPSSEEAPFSLSHLSFPTFAISKKESKVATIAVPGNNIQGEQLRQGTLSQQMSSNREYGLNTLPASLLHIPEAHQCQSFWCESRDDTQDVAAVISYPHLLNNSIYNYQSHQDTYLGLSWPQRQSMESDLRDIPSGDDKYSAEESSDNSSTDKNVRHRSRNGDSSCSSEADDDDDKDDITSEDELPFVDSMFPRGLISLGPCLGPFDCTKESPLARNWTQALHQRFRNIRGGGINDNDTQKPSLQMTARLMTDYLSHYIEHDHPRLVRAFPSIFPNLPAESFDQLLSARASPLVASPDDSPSLRYPVLNFFQSLQQSHKNLQSLRKAHSIYIMVERNLLHHSPRRIRSISLSASRIHAITHPPNRQHALSSSESRSNTLGRTLVSPLTSLISLLSISPFSKTTSTPPSPPASWHSFASSSTVFSSQSTHTAISSSSTTDSCSWTNVPQLCKLKHLHRIELYDIYHGIDVDAVVDFLKMHDRIYNSIREIKVGGPDDLGRSSHPDVIQIIQSLKTIKVLDMTEWREAIKHMDQIPTKHLETLLLGNVRMTTLKNTEPSALPPEGDNNELLGGKEGIQLHPEIQALQRCRLLRELRMPVLIEGLFEWAVHERQQKAEAPSSSSPIPYVSPLTKTAPYWDGGRDPLAQLENVHLSGTVTGPLISTLTHVVDAFRDSIQVLQSNSWVDSTETLTFCLNLSWAWCLPQLQVLDLQGEIAHRFRIQSLQHCPLLRILRLTLLHYVTPASSVELADCSIQCQRCICEGGGIGDGECNSCGQQLRPLSLADYFCPESDSGTMPPCSSRSRQMRPVLFPRLQELKLVGDWGLRDESLLGIRQAIPQLTRLSLLRCEGHRLTARGLVCALPSLWLKDQYRLRSLEVSKAWQSELETALEDRDMYM
ncbi:hypothetical protein BGX20_004108, partial [Mortierella sp. AD010]